MNVEQQKRALATVRSALVTVASEHKMNQKTYSAWKSFIGTIKSDLWILEMTLEAHKPNQKTKSKA